MYEFEVEIAEAAKSPGGLSPRMLRQAKRLGFSDKHLGMILGTSELEVRALR